MKKTMSDRSINGVKKSTTKWQADLVLARYVKTSSKWLFSYTDKKKREEKKKWGRLDCKDWLKWSIILVKAEQCLSLFWVKASGGKFNHTHYEDVCDSA